MQIFQNIFNDRTLWTFAQNANGIPVFDVLFGRYLIPPSQWVEAAPESPELLALCIKRVRGLNKGVSVKNAKFVWTEPHSRRILIEVSR